MNDVLIFDVLIIGNSVSEDGGGMANSAMGKGIKLNRFRCMGIILLAGLRSGLAWVGNLVRITKKSSVRKYPAR